jgi:hypothetical protein
MVVSESTFTTGFILPHYRRAIHALEILTSYDERYIIMVFDEGTTDVAASFNLAHVAFVTYLLHGAQSLLRR